MKYPTTRAHTLVTSFGRILRYSQLHFVVDQPDLLARLERRQTDVRAAIAAESISKRTVATRSNLALYREIHFGEVIRAQLGKAGVGVRSLLLVLSLDSLRETAGAVFACAPAFGVGLAGFGCFVVS